MKQPAHALTAGDAIEVQLRENPVAPAAAEEVPPAPSGEGVSAAVKGALAESRILHLDALVVAVDKPAGVLSQEGRAGGPALPDLVSALLRARGEDPRALLVHRLDRGTTGCTLLARTRPAQAALLDEFRSGRVRKEYRAWVRGEPRDDAFVVDLSLGPDPHAPGKRRPDPKGESARTRFSVLERHAGTALIAAFPETGRTHQIRVHLAAQGLPLLGDARYGGPRELTSPDGTRLDFTRPMLHALSIETVHPKGGALTVTAPLPEDFAAAGLVTR